MRTPVKETEARILIFSPYCFAFFAAAQLISVGWRLSLGLAFEVPPRAFRFPAACFNAAAAGRTRGVAAAGCSCDGTSLPRQVSTC